VSRFEADVAALNCLKSTVVVVGTLTAAHLTVDSAATVTTGATEKTAGNVQVVVVLLLNMLPDALLTS
jgi:hypothetical protein